MRLWDYIKKVNDSGTTIFLTTHYMDEADQVSDWTDIIDHGKVIAAGTPEKLKDNLGQDMIYLETLNDDASLRLLRELEVVKVANRSTKGLVVTIDADGPHCLPTIMETLKEQGIHLTSVNLKKPILDDVFVHYLPFLGAGVIALTTLFTSLFGGISLLFDENWGLLR